jgi:phosphoribosylanthranilate isomerase
MILKATNVTTLTDARYFAAKGVDYLGFNLEQSSPGYVAPEYMRAIAEWIQGPRIAGDFTHTPATVIRDFAERYHLDAVQVAPVHTEEIADLEGLEVLWWWNAPLPDTSLLDRIVRPFRPLFKYLVLNAEQLPVTADWQAFFQEYPVLLHSERYDLPLWERLKTMGAAGISISGGAEDRVGLKSFEAMDDLLDAL